jgi:ankyrin repeat protein
MATDTGAAFLMAARAGNLEAITNLLAQEAHVIFAKDNHDHTALMMAARQGWGHVVSFLIKAGASVNDRDAYGGKLQGKGSRRFAMANQTL